MPKAGRRRTRGNLVTERGREAKKKKKRADDRPVLLAAFVESKKSQSEAKLDRVYADVVDSATEESSDPPSPLLHRPYIPDELAGRADILAAFREANATYEADIERRSAVLTMDLYSSSSCLSNDRRLLHIREAAKDAVLLAANSIISLSSYLDDEPLNRCCGLWIQRDDKKKTALVLTSAYLIRAKDPSLVRNQRTGEYHRDASVIVHLLDGTTALARFIYLQEHYDLALYEVVVDKPVQLSTFNDNVHSGQDVLRLGRDESLDLRITHGRVEYRFPDHHERCHYMYFSHDELSVSSTTTSKPYSQGSWDRLDECSLHEDGGPIIDLEGKVVGMVISQMKDTFLPSSILHKCLDFWRKLKCIPRAHLGMTFTPIKFLDPICIERMRRKHNIESGLIVEQVSKESNAEKLGIRKGDIIERLNGQYISTTTELEKMLLDIGGDHFPKAKVSNAKLDIRIQIFRATKLCRRARNLTVTVSDCGEDIIEGTCPITVGLWR
ncbi:hypothetical protein QYE76_066047 [Lolium multiflorum]|uniref:PDZ domain-containing protein n=1 Tax=Lolium multiflorum TaxID=4521 RepID=A0AAD8WBQ8_LOLMU|nr:hypothetical protein QYE76_066047 [Lolium multiflorum]